MSHIDQLKASLPESALADGEVAWQDADGFQADFQFANIIADRWCRRLTFMTDDRALLLKSLDKVEKEFSELIKNCEAEFTKRELKGLGLSVHFKPFSRRAEILWRAEETRLAIALVNPLE